MSKNRNPGTGGIDVVNTSSGLMNVKTLWSRVKGVTQLNDEIIKYTEDFCNKLQMIFDMSNTSKLTSSANNMEVVGEVTIGEYVVDNNFTIKSIGDSFHDMFDKSRSNLDRNINTFQEILLARFAGSFRADDMASNVDLLYKLLQIYHECLQKNDFFDKDGNPKNVDGNEIAKVIFHTPLRN